jgi:hypothetical protein
MTISYKDIIRLQWPNKTPVQFNNDTYAGIVWNALDATANPTQAELDAAIVTLEGSQARIKGNTAVATADQIDVMYGFDLADSGVTPGTYTVANITVNSKGIVTAASPSTAGTVNTISIIPANGITGTVATASTTPAITLSLGAITPSSVAATGTVTGSNLSGTNTGDQVIPTTLPASDVSAWAKAATKPTYTATEVGLSNVPNLAFSGSNTGDETATTIRTKLGITTLSGSNTGDQVIPTTLPASDVSAWAKAAIKPTYSAAEIGLGNVPNLTFSGSNTGDQTITLTGDVTGSGTGSFVTTLKNTGTAGTYTKVTTDAQGRVTAGTSLTSVDITTALGFTPASSVVGANKLLQSISSQVAAATGTTFSVFTNATPTSTMGTQIWSNTITPSAATSTILISGSFLYTSSVAGKGLMAFLFRGTTCVGTTAAWCATASTSLTPVVFNMIDTPASTSAQTYTIRVAGGTAQTWYINQFPTAYFNGTLAKSTITLQELS